MKLIIENVRSFAGRHEITIKPLTLLVGENSAGKTTLLAALAAVSDLTQFPGSPSLNKDPYDLGSYRTIATYKGGKYGRAKSFSLGFVERLKRRDVEQSLASENSDLSVCATYGEAKGEAVLRALQLKTPRWQLSGQVEDGRFTGSLLYKGETSSNIPISAEIDATKLSMEQSLAALMLPLFRQVGRELRTNEVLEHFLEIGNQLSNAVSTTLSISPIRSKPRRVYDRSSVAYDPSGEHVPYALAKFLNDAHEKKHKQLREALDTFGRESGLFRRIDAPLLRHRPASPFQIEVTLTGPARNLLDVGYGVSQSLPVITQSVLAEQNTRILVQQPEVHLHPKAQAALGTFVTNLVRDANREFVIETHSDYMLDRIRQEVAAQRLKPDLVSILFFDRKNLETEVHELSLDGAGNILNAPANYRAFFLEEELNLLNRVGDAVCV